MTDTNEPYKYDLALREWESQGYVVDRSPVMDRTNEDVVYYHEGLNEYRLGRYLLTFNQLGDFTTGGWVVVEHHMPETIQEWTPLGEVIGLKPETVTDPPSRAVRRPGYWIVLNLGKVDIVHGSNTRKVVRVENT